MVSIIYNNLGDGIADTEDLEQNIALGRFMTAWSEVEKACGFLFRDLANMQSEVSRIIFDNVGAREQIAILNAMIDPFVLAVERDEAEAALKEVASLSEKRNKIAHAGWGTYNNEKARYWHSLTSANVKEMARETAKGQSLRARSVHTISDLNDATTRCLAAYNRIVALHANVSIDGRPEQMGHRANLRAWYESRGLGDPISWIHPAVRAQRFQETDTPPESPPQSSET